MSLVLEMQMNQRIFCIILKKRQLSIIFGREEGVGDMRKIEEKTSWRRGRGDKENRIKLDIRFKFGKWDKGKFCKGGGEEGEEGVDDQNLKARWFGGMRRMMEVW